MNNNNQNSMLNYNANKVLVGGVSSGWNFLPYYGPLYVKNASGAHVFDVNNNKYIDFNMGHSSLLLGHNPLSIRTALKDIIDKGFLFPYETEFHIKLAEKIHSHVPCADMVRLANSGLECTMYAVRLARAVTNKNKIIKFEGNFHGLNDNLLFSIDSSPELGDIDRMGIIKPIPGSSGISISIENDIIVLPFNNIQSFKNAIQEYKDDIAAVILEPIAFNVGCLRAEHDFLLRIRQITDDLNVILIFDEMLTGFRLGLGGAQKYYGITPDLSCFGKALGCGLPIAALAGKKEFMKQLSPIGKVEMSGTNTGRIFSIIGTLSALDHLEKPNFYDNLNHLTDFFINGFIQITEKFDLPCWIDGIGGLIGVYFGLKTKPTNLRDITLNWNKTLSEYFYKKAFENKLYWFLAPSYYYPERITISNAHTYQDLSETLSICEDILNEAKNKGLV